MHLFATSALLFENFVSAAVGNKILMRLQQEQGVPIS
jgi:hypothetical protein